MRFTMYFYLEQPEISVEYRRSILSFIKTALTRCNEGKYYEQYYKDTIQKDFNWYAVFPRPVFTSDKILLEKNAFKVIFSTKDTNHSGYILFMAMNEMLHKKFPLENGNHMMLNRVQQNTTKAILSEACIFKTSIGSPCVVREHNRDNNQDRYYSITDSGYDEVLTAALRRQAKDAGFDEQDVERILAKAVRGKKVIVKHYGQSIDTTQGIFILNGPSLILQHFYEVGICSRRSAGFGSIELIAERG